MHAALEGVLQLLFEPGPVRDGVAGHVDADLEAEMNDALDQLQLVIIISTCRAAAIQLAQGVAAPSRAAASSITPPVLAG